MNDGQMCVGGIQGATPGKYIFSTTATFDGKTWTAVSPTIAGLAPAVEDSWQWHQSGMVLGIIFAIVYLIERLNR